MIRLPDRDDPDHDDAVRWWQAYLLADRDGIDELHERAGAGDDHARRQLACWLGDRGRAEEAISVIRPLTDGGEDIAQLWLARWLAECGRIDELRDRADAGDRHALAELADLLASQNRWADVRELACGPTGVRPELAAWLARQGDIDALRIAADAGDIDAQRRLARWLARHGQDDELRRRAGAGDYYAQSCLALPEA
jgi:hypothetical protein